MPFLVDTLASGDEADLGLDDPPPGLIDKVKADGSRRCADRRRRNLGVAVTVAFLAVPTAALRSGNGDGQPEISVAAGGDSSITTEVFEPAEPVLLVETTTSSPASATSAPAWLPPRPPPDGPPPVTGPPLVWPTSAPPTTAASGSASAATPTTALVCRNSDNPACGPFRWDPAPSPNQPLVATFTKAPATAVVGQTLDFEVAWSDGDATLDHQLVAVDSMMHVACDRPFRYGPWTPPAAVAGSGTIPLSHTFQEPGTFTVIASLGTTDCSSPYGNDLVIKHTVTVEPVVETG